MTYQSTLTELTGTLSNDALIEKVNANVETIIASQGVDATTEIHRFMLYHTSRMDVRISGMMKHLAARQPIPPNPKEVPALKDTGLMGAWRSVDNSKEQINHLLIGLPFMYSVLITTKTDKLNNKSYIHSVVGTFTKIDFGAMGTNPASQTETVSSYKEVSRILGYLDKLTKEEPIIPIVKDEKKTMSYANKQYEARWVKSNGSLPHVSTLTP